MKDIKMSLNDVVISCIMVLLFLLILSGVFKCHNDTFVSHIDKSQYIYYCSVAEGDNCGYFSNITLGTLYYNLTSYTPDTVYHNLTSSKNFSNVLSFNYVNWSGLYAGLYESEWHCFNDSDVCYRITDIYMS